MDMRRRSDTEKFEWQLEQLNTDYADVGILHCVDDDADLAWLIRNDIPAMLTKYKEKGRIRRIGFSTETPAMAGKLMNLGIFDIAMSGVNIFDEMRNAAEYDSISDKLEKADVFAMRIFRGGTLLNEAASPFANALTVPQCIRYALERKGVVSAIAGVRSLAELDEVLAFEDEKAEWHLPRLKEEWNNVQADNVVDFFKYKDRMAR